MSPDPSLKTATLSPEAPAPDTSTEVIPETPLDPTPEATAEAILEASTVEAPTLDPAQVVSTYADTLMVGLFGDLDRLLDGDEEALVAVEAELKAPPCPIDELIEASDPIPTMAFPASEESALTVPTATPLASASEGLDASVSSQKTVLRQVVDRLLLACTAVSLVGIVAVLWLGQRAGGILSSAPTADDAPTAAQSDAEFLAYLQRSLEVVEKQAEQAQSEPSQPQGPWPNGALIPPGANLGAPQGTGAELPGRINVIERVYIPYQTTPPTLPPAPPSAPVAPPPVATTTPNRPTPSPVPAAPATPSQPATPTTSHVLMGVLELGDRSAALFDINGVSQRVYIGERIGNGGWTLVSISNQEAVIRRNGEVRSLYIGQQF